MPINLKHILASQFESALCMLRECIEKCPPEHWDGTIGKYPFWHVAYHTLCFIDVYLTARDEDWRPHGEFHPAGKKELEDEYPSRRFTQAELLAYTDFCRGKLNAVLGDGPGSETMESLENPSGFSWLKFTRAELHVYSIRHVQHHMGQLGAYLRRAGVGVEWVKAGWR